MSGEKNLEILLKTIKPELNPGEYVFCKVDNLDIINPENIIILFKEKEALTIILKREIAESFNLEYSYVASWITLTVHSSLEAVGLTAAFSKVLSENDISCNVVAAYYHDHIFVDVRNTDKAMSVLNNFSS